MQYFKQQFNLKNVGFAALVSSLMVMSSSQVFAQEEPKENQAVTTVKIGSLISGQVTKQFVSEGQMVKAGQQLLNLDGARYQAKLAFLKAQQKAAKFNLDDAKIELDQALDLYDRTVTAKRTRDASQLRFDMAKANYDKARAEVAMHQAWSKYVYIKAPVNGKVSKILAPVGTTVYKENTIMLELETE